MSSDISANATDRPWEKFYSDEAKSFDPDNLPLSLLSEFPVVAAKDFGPRPRADHPIAERRLGDHHICRA